MTYSELFSLCLDRLKAAGIEEYESDSRLLFQYLLDADRSFMFMHGMDEVTNEQEEAILKAIEIRQKRVPLQHITGYQNFMGLEFRVSKDCLIPRFDTECLVEEAMLVCNDGDKVLDVCTGSGCILISLMKYKNYLTGYGLDISDAALNIARENAKLLGNCEEDFFTDALAKEPVFIQSDLFENITETDFDIIVSNPPYIRSDVIPGLMPEVKDHDPRLALDGGEDGLVFYRKIVDEARNYLKKGGHLLVEIGNDQGDSVKDLFLTNGYKEVRVVKDLSGNDRVVAGHL